MTPQVDGGQTEDANSVDSASGYDLAYPSDLTTRVLDRWRQVKIAGDVPIADQSLPDL